jgi:hypothetical protein
MEEKVYGFLSISKEFPMKIQKLFLLIVASVFLWTPLLPAQQLRLGADGAVSKMIGSDFTDFNWGFSVGGHFLFYIDDNILLGIRGAYNRWTPDEDDFSESVSNLFSGDVEGNAWSVEIIPTLRLTTNYPMSFINFFAQAGAGVYILSDEVVVKGISTTDDSPVQQIFGEGTRGRFGIQLGGGFSLGSSRFASIDIFSLYNLVFAGSEDALQYFTINLGLSFGI